MGKNPWLEGAQEKQREDEEADRANGVVRSSPVTGSRARGRWLEEDVGPNGEQGPELGQRWWRRRRPGGGSVLVSLEGSAWRGGLASFNSMQRFMESPGIFNVCFSVY